MSVSVLFHGADDGDDGPFHLASGAGWKLFCDWAEQSEPLAALSAGGDFVGTDQLADELGKLLDARPPDNPDVKSTAEHLLQLVGVGHSGETMEVEL